MGDAVKRVFGDLAKAEDRRMASEVKLLRSVVRKLREAEERDDWDLVTRVCEVIDDLLAEPAFKIEETS